MSLKTQPTSIRLPVDLAALLDAQEGKSMSAKIIHHIRRSLSISNTDLYLVEIENALVALRKEIASIQPQEIPEIPDYGPDLKEIKAQITSLSEAVDELSQKRFFFGKSKKQNHT